MKSRVEFFFFSGNTARFKIGGLFDVNAHSCPPGTQRHRLPTRAATVPSSFDRLRRKAEDYGYFLPLSGHIRVTVSQEKVASPHLMLAGVATVSPETASARGIFRAAQFFPNTGIRTSKTNCV